MQLKTMCLALVMVSFALPATLRAGTPAPGATPAGFSAYASLDDAVTASFAEEHAHYFQTDPAATAAPAKQQSYWPVLYSALIPGLGELTMGYEKRGIALMAVEVAAWAGYFVNHSNGMDTRDEYEAFADQYWTQRKFIDHHPLVYNLPNVTQEELEEMGRSVSGSGGPWYNGYVPWISKEEDKQHYYENIGKYDWFVSGWSDYVPSFSDPQPNSELRDQYVEMRNESNNSLDDANAFVWVSLATRVFSIAETAIIIRGHRKEGEAQSSNGFETPVALRARPRGYTGGELALEVRF